MLYRCQAVLQHTSGIPKNAVSNTFWFQTANVAPDNVEAEAIAEHVRDFYVGIRGTAEVSMANYFASSIATNGHSVKVAPIDVLTGEDERGAGQPPLHTEPFDLVGRIAGEIGLPSEVALCLSYKSVSAGFTPPARKRGRIYFGPLEASLVAMRASSIVVPTNELRNDLLSAGRAMIDSAPADADWVVYSRPYEGRGVIERANKPDLPAIPARQGATFLVNQVWVDDAFDTQRRRGEAASLRITA